jgi:outer membrane protein N
VLLLLSWTQHVVALDDVLILSSADEQRAATADTEKTEKELAARRTAVQREADASEDPMVKREILSMEDPDKAAIKAHSIRGYGNLRLRLRSTDSDNLKLSDDGSRFGADGHYQLSPKLKIFGRAEVGFNLLSNLASITNSKDSAPEGKAGDNVFERLLYVGFEAPGYFLTLGKNWSTYYKVAGFTDRFSGTGGDASGTYNAGTDGGATGTGRAQGALQTRLHFGRLTEQIGIKPLNLNLQVQHGEPIPLVDGEHYGTALGLSTVYQFKSDLALGIAYNLAQINNLDDPAIQNAGLDGDAQAILLGGRQAGEKWYLGTVVARLLNQETTDEGMYFDGWGWEVYGQYQLRKKIWLTGGWNYLRPDSDQSSGDYMIKYGVSGLHYSLNESQDKVYANVQFNDGRLADGQALDNVFTIGIQWGFGEIANWMVDNYRHLRARQGG